MKTIHTLAMARLIHLFRQVLRADTVIRLEHEESRFFGVLHQVYRKRIERFFRKRVGEAALAAELTQEVFLRAFQGLSLMQPGRDFGAWLGTIARHLWIDHARKSQRIGYEVPWTDECDSDGGLSERARTETPESALERDELRGAFRRELADLAPIQRKAAILKFFGGWSDLEIAETLRMSLPATKSMLFRIRRRLQRELTIQPVPG